VLLNGLEPAALQWNEPLANNTPCALPSGVYHYDAFDVYGCNVSGSIEVVAPDPVVVSSLPAIICGGETTQAELSATGGTGAYLFSVEGADINALTPGDYVGVAIDENGCQGSVNFAVASYPAVNFTANADSICVGGVAGLQYFGSGGALPYSYDWQGQNPAALQAGEYTFTLTDANGCTDVVSIVVAEYPLLVAQISSFTDANNGANGSMELTISGGQPPYAIVWSTGDTDDVLDSIGQGMYSVTVTDFNGCESSDNQSIIDLEVAEVAPAIRVYPNPVVSWLMIESAHAGSYHVHDAAGRLVLSGKLLSGKTGIDTSGWTSGAFVLKWDTETSFGIISVVKD
jgi:hypothetical protein